MNLFESLLIGHLVGDFLLQNRWMAENENRRLSPLLLHCLVYTLAIYFFSRPAGGISLIALAVVYFSHALLDQRQVVQWWMEKITRSADIKWLHVAADQTFHILILAAVVAIQS